MMALEQMLLCVNPYISNLYGFIRLLFESYPIKFKKKRGYTLGVSAPPFLPICIGIMLGFGMVAWYTQTRMKANFTPVIGR